MQFELKKSQCWNTSVKYDYLFATQYNNCLVYFGIPSDASKATYMCGHHGCIMTGCIAILIDKDGSYHWYPLPQLNVKLSKRNEKVQLCGGYVCGKEMKVFGNGTLTKPATHLTETKCWTRSLAIPPVPSQYDNWPITTPPVFPTVASLVLQTVQKVMQHIVFFYTPQSPPENEDSPFYTLIISDDEQRSCTFSSVISFSRFINCAVVDTNMYIMNGDKMAIVKDFDCSLTVNNTQTAGDSMQFNIIAPHTDSTLFVVQDTLCALGGHDQDYDDPFSNVYQFNHSTQEWNECGSLAVSRYGASVVVLTDKNKEEVVLVVGGFKGENMPCSTLEKLSVIEF